MNANWYAATVVYAAIILGLLGLYLASNRRSRPNTQAKDGSGFTPLSQEIAGILLEPYTAEAKQVLWAQCRQKTVATGGYRGAPALGVYVQNIGNKHRTIVVGPSGYVGPFGRIPNAVVKITLNLSFNTVILELPGTRYQSENGKNIRTEFNRLLAIASDAVHNWKPPEQTAA